MAAQSRAADDFGGAWSEAGDGLKVDCPAVAAVINRARRYHDIRDAYCRRVVDIDAVANGYSYLFGNIVIADIGAEANCPAVQTWRESSQSQRVPVPARFP